MNQLQALRPTALPALAFLVWWPLFALLPARHTRAFFILAGLVTLVVVEGPWLALGLLAAIVLGYVGVERVVRLRSGRRAAFGALLALIHAVYWATFFLPLPAAYAGPQLRPADWPGTFVLMSGIGLTFVRLVSYAWDRMRGVQREGAAPAEPSTATGFRDYLTYMLFFPQFRHGPVERCAAFAERIRTARRTWTPRDAGVGLLRIAWALLVLNGLAKAGALVEKATGRQLTSAVWDGLSQPERLSGTQWLVIVLAPALVLYVMESSFAGVQLGVSRVFGVHGTENFRYPLLARSPREVWHRWNITVSQWLRDYAYIPLGGGRQRRYLNTLLVFVYCGLLHGPQWRCVVWGLWSGGTLAGLRWIGDRLPARRDDAPPRPRWLEVARGVLARLGTFLWFCVGVTIIVDPASCGWGLLRRGVELLGAALGV